MPTARTGQVIREDLYLAVATVIAFVFNTVILALAVNMAVSLL